VSTLRVDLAAIRTAHLLAGVALDTRAPNLAMVVESISLGEGRGPSHGGDTLGGPDLLAARAPPPPPTCAAPTQLSRPLEMDRLESFRADWNRSGPLPARWPDVIHRSPASAGGDDGMASWSVLWAGPA
jgi:hypothetical protein